MRKVDPATVYQRLSKELDTLKSLYNRGNKGLRGRTHGDLYRGKLAEIVFHKAYVAFEIFVSDLFVGLINRDPWTYQEWKIRREYQRIAEAVSPWIYQRTTITPKSHLRVDEVREVLDPNRYNVTFSSARYMRKRAKQWLSPRNAIGILSLNVSDRDFLNCAVSLRNFVAHESHSAHQTMNNQLVRVAKTGANTEFNRSTHGVNSVGAYLRSVKLGKSRVVHYIERLDNIAVKMRP